VHRPPIAYFHQPTAIKQAHWAPKVHDRALSYQRVSEANGTSNLASPLQTVNMASSMSSSLKSSLTLARDPSLSASSAAAAQVGLSSTVADNLQHAAQLSDMSRQLALQSEMNSNLLAQVTRLEEENLALSRTGQENRAALRQALAVADAARADANDAKRRLAIAQEVSVRMSDELKEARVEGGAMKRQLEALERASEEAQRELAQLTAVKNTNNAEVSN
jgi:chromosome segregation ATPase